MKPQIILHMMTTLDGRIITSNWPKDFDSSAIYEDIHSTLKGDAWLVGRVTMAEFSKGEPRPVTDTPSLPRQTWRAPGAESGPFAVAIDRKGKLHLNRAQANGDPIVAVLTEQVSDEHLAELRRDGISYFFAGTDDIDLSVAVGILGSEFGVKRLLLEGGGHINGAFLAAGLIDELSILLCPFTDGKTGVQSVFESPVSIPKTFALQDMSRLDHDMLHLRYERKAV